MNTVGPLKSQQRALEKLFFRIANTADHQTRTQLFQELADQLVAYAAIEGRPASYRWVSERTGKAALV